MGRRAQAKHTSLLCATSSIPSGSPAWEQLVAAEAAGRLGTGTGLIMLPDQELMRSSTPSASFSFS